MSELIKPTTAPAIEQVQRLDEALELIEEDSELPANWILVIEQTWQRVRSALVGKTTATHPELGTLAVRLSRAGANACAVAAEEASSFKKYQWLRAGRAHRIAHSAIMVGWPPNRPIATDYPTEFSNLRDRARKPIINSSGEQSLLFLIYDPLDIASKQVALAALEIVSGGVYLDGPP